MTRLTAEMIATVVLARAGGRRAVISSAVALRMTTSGRAC
jgi:hypothetical protein